MISVVVLNCNGGETTKRCLESVVKTNYTDYEVIIVDNKSELPSERYDVWVPVATHNIMRIIPLRENKWYAGGMNAGITQTKGEVIICLPNDTVVHPDWLAYISIAMQDKKIGAANPMLLQYITHRTNIIETAIPKLTKFGYNYCKGIGEENEGQYDREVPDYVSGACFITRRSVIDKVGMFDERMGMWWQDVDLSLRIRKAGYKLALISKATVWHIGGDTVKGWNWLRRKWVMNENRAIGMWKMMRGEYR